MTSNGLSSELEKYRGAFFEGIPNEMHKQIVGADDFIWMLVLTLLAGSGDGEETESEEIGNEEPRKPEYHAHLLVESDVGEGKTGISRAFARTIGGAKFRRIQFERDLKPFSLKQTAELQEDNAVKFFEGPLNANIILADELTRASGTVHAGMIEAMAEGILALPSRTIKTPRPYMIIATANPRDLSGVAKLDTAISDRFAFRIDPSEYTPEQRIEIMLGQEKRAKEEIGAAVHVSDVLHGRSRIHEEIFVSYEVASMIERLTRLAWIRFRDKQDYSKHGASGERPATWLKRASKVLAVYMKRMYVTPGDVVRLAYPVLRHRIDLGFGISGEKKRVRINELISEVGYETAGLTARSTA